MIKAAVDKNFQRHLDDLASHPALFERAKGLYYEKLTNNWTLDDIAKKYGIHISTASRYITAYKKAIAQFGSLDIPDLVASCEAEIRLLAEKRTTIAQPFFAPLTREIRQYKELIAELLGLLARKTEVNINISTVNVMMEVFPRVLLRNLESGVAEKILNELGSELETHTLAKTT